MTPTCCSHLNARCIEKAVVAVQHARLSRSSHDSICVECGLSGFFNDAKFRLHFLIEQHYLYVRVKEPLELYCCHCGDFQYSDDFDLLIGRKRFRRTHSTQESRRSKKTLIDRPRPRAIVNLGATCFMGSVLQVMLNNSVIFFSKQMQLNRGGLDLCSKGKHEIQKSNIESSNSNSIIGGSSTVTVKEGSTTGSAIVISNSSSISSSTSTSTSTSSSLISSGCIACEFKSLFWESAAERISLSSSLKGKVGSGDLSCIVPSNLLYSVWSHADYMAGYDQQDAHEFLIALLDGLGSHLERYHGEANTSYPRYPSPQYDQNTNTNMSAASSLDQSQCFSLGSGDSSTKIPVTHSTNLNSLPQVSLLHPSSILLPPPLHPLESQGDSPIFHTSASHIQNHGPWSPRITANKSSCFKGFVNEIFAGWMQSELHCMHCGHCSYKLEPFLDISLSLEIAPLAENLPLSLPIPDFPSAVPHSFPVHRFPSDTESIISNKRDDEGIATGMTESDLISDSDEAALHTHVEAEVDSPAPEEYSSSHHIPEEVFPIQTNLKSVKSRPAREEVIISLTGCLQHFTSLEILSEQVHCDSCKQHRPCKKGLSISTAPKVLVLHFKRFDSLRQLKICSKVDFPLRGFDFAPFMQKKLHPKNQSPSSSSSKTNDNSSGYRDQGHRSSHTPLLYDLQGLVNHKGSLTQGHYVAYVAAMKDEGADTQTTSWMRCDDETVTTVSEEDVLNAEGYILFYVNRNDMYG